MTHQVALSNEAYASLRRRKGPADSFSDVVLRLMRQADHAADPMHFAAFPHDFTLSADEHVRQVQLDRENDRSEPRRRRA